MNSHINRTIILPISEEYYHQIIDNKVLFKKELESLFEKYPEIFPTAISAGFRFVGHSKNDSKLNIRRRIIRLKMPFNTYEDYLLHPCFIMPYLRGKTVDVSKGLLLRKYSTPYHAIATVLGKNSMYWYRAEVSLSQYNIVGTTVKNSLKLPRNLLLDEHHTQLKASKIYICTTVAENCFLGVGISPTMQYADLKNAYKIFKSEAQTIMPTYVPKSINIDGYKSTKKAILQLYAPVGILRCFLHAFLKIRNCGTKAYDLYFNHVSNRVWYCYEAENKRSFAQRISKLKQWTLQVIPQSPFKKSILQLCEKKRIYGSL